VANESQVGKSYRKVQKVRPVVRLSVSDEFSHTKIILGWPWKRRMLQPPNAEPRTTNQMNGIPILMNAVLARK